jgi:hypothetical protein
MNPDRAPRSANAFLGAWWIMWLGLLVFVAYILSIMAAQGVCLEIVGNATGQGVHTLEVLPNLTNLTTEEATFVLGPGYGYNVSRDGLVTFSNGSSWQIIVCTGEKA